MNVTVRKYSKHNMGVCCDSNTILILVKLMNMLGYVELVERASVQMSKFELLVIM